MTRKMKKSNTLHEYYTKKIDKIHLGLRTVKQIPSEKNIHELRVEIKHWRAVINLLKTIAPANFTAFCHHNPLHKIFKLAGHVRELQINSHLLIKCKFPNELHAIYSSYSTTNEAKYLNELNKQITEFDYQLLNRINKQVKRTIKSLNEITIANEALIYIKTETAKTKEILRPEYNHVIIHRIRTHLRSANLCTAFTKAIKPSIQLAHYFNALKKTAESIGKIHDNIVLIQYLESSIIKTDQIQGKQLSVVIRGIEKFKKRNQAIYKNSKKEIESILKYNHRISL